MLKREKVNDVAKKTGINRTYLSKIENGHIKPSLGVLDKLINYFSIPAPAALTLYSLAGYSDSHVVIEKNTGEEVSKMENKQIPTTEEPGQIQVTIPNDKPVLYSDSVFLTSNEFGLVFDFSQRMASTNKHIVVSRIGMSKEHAKVLLKILREKVEGKSEVKKPAEV